MCYLHVLFTSAEDLVHFATVRDPQLSYFKDKVNIWSLLFKTVSYPILEYTLLVALNDTLGGFILP